MVSLVSMLFAGSGSILGGTCNQLLWFAWLPAGQVSERAVAMFCDVCYCFACGQPLVRVLRLSPRAHRTFLTALHVFYMSFTCLLHVFCVYFACYLTSVVLCLNPTRGLSNVEVFRYAFSFVRIALLQTGSGWISVLANSSA